MCNITTTETAEAKVYAHPFQERGMGVAPYEFICVISLPSPSLACQNPDAYRNGMEAAFGQASRFGVTLCSCDYCGTPILHNFVIRDGNKDYFVVGCDCIWKTNDAELITVAESARRDMERRAREAKQAAKYAAQVAERLAKQNAERAAYGLTLDERFEAFTAASTAKYQAAIAGLCSDLTAVIITADPGNGNFLPSIIAELTAGKSLLNYSDRAVYILAEVYAKTKTGKTARNKANQDAQDEFFTVYNAAREIQEAASKTTAAELYAIKEAFWSAKKAGEKTFQIAPELIPFLTPDAAAKLSGNASDVVADDAAKAEQMKKNAIQYSAEAAMQAIVICATYYGENSIIGDAPLALEATRTALKVAERNAEASRIKTRTLKDAYILLGGTMEGFQEAFLTVAKTRAEEAARIAGKAPVIIAIDTPGVSNIKSSAELRTPVDPANPYPFFVVILTKDALSMTPDEPPAPFPALYWNGKGEYVAGIENAARYDSMEDISRIEFYVPGMSCAQPFKSASKGWIRGLSGSIAARNDQEAIAEGKQARPAPAPFFTAQSVAYYRNLGIENDNLSSVLYYAVVRKVKQAINAAPLFLQTNGTYGKSLETAACFPVLGGGQVPITGTMRNTLIPVPDWKYMKREAFDMQWKGFIKFMTLADAEALLIPKESTT